jgi:hypothetical protein
LKNGCPGRLGWISGKINAQVIYNSKRKTHSDDSIFSLEGMIIIRQLRRMVKMMVNEKRGWTRMWMATRRTGLNGDRALKINFYKNRNKLFLLYNWLFF